MGTKVKHSAITLHHSFGNTQTNKHIRQGQKYVLTQKPGDQDNFFLANGGNIQNAIGPQVTCKPEMYDLSMLGLQNL